MTAADEDLETLALDSSSKAAAAAASSADPLLHPSPSPSATSSSPTAAANHDAFIDEDAEYDFDSFPSPDAPVISRVASPEFSQITVSEPKKHAEPATGAAGVIPGSSSYFSCLFTTRVADGGEFRVRRRFREVVALADLLAATHRGIFVPSRADKSIIERQVMPRLDFVNQRCIALQRYLCRLAVHPTVGRNADLHAFLTEPSGIPTSEGESPKCPVEEETDTKKDGEPVKFDSRGYTRGNYRRKVFLDCMICELDTAAVYRTCCDNVYCQQCAISCCEL